MSGIQTGTIETRIPSRLDRLPWSRFHWRIIFGLGTAWILDGLEVTIVGAVASRLTEHGSGIAISSAGIGIAAALYVAGACTGALFFGWLTDRFGRKRLFMITLGVYMAATAITAVSFSPLFFFIFRFITGAGIGGEYAAINSAIDELIPARARGRVDLVVNGSFWIGSIIGSALAIAFLNKAWFPTDVGWRLTFAIGLVLGTVVLLIRRHVPESPRWLFIHGREEEAEALVDRIESEVADETGTELEPVTKVLQVRQRLTIGFVEIARTAFKVYPKRSILCLALFVGQAFIYNGITFNLGTLMSTFFHVASGVVPVFLIIYACANFLGPLILGRLFDTVGRKPMISGTYLGSAVLGVLLAALFAQSGFLGRWTFMIVLIGTFFLASSGASAAYLTSSEIFPMETRALAIAFFYAIGTAVGGITGPLLFGPLIATKDNGLVAIAFLIGSVLMALGGVAELVFGVKAEQVQLEDIAKPITVEDAEREAGRSPDGAGAGSSGGTPTIADHEQWSIARKARQEAAWERARVAEHRSREYGQRAAAVAGDPEAAERAETEELLARISEETAMAHEERAVAADERATLPAGGGTIATVVSAIQPTREDGDAATPEADGRAPDGSDGGDHSHDGVAAGYRALAAEHRANSHDEEARSLASDDGTEADRHRAMAAAELETAREAEQRALAAEAVQRASRSAVEGTEDPPGVPDDTGDPSGRSGHAESGSSGGTQDHPMPVRDGDPVDSDVPDMAERERQRARIHDAWADMHAQLARMHQCRARGEDGSTASREAEISADRARAASFQLEAWERRADALAERQEEVAAQEAESRRGEEARAEERRRAARDTEEDRIRARLERRHQRETAGLRRYRPGPGRLGTPPAITAVTPLPEEALDHEIIAIERALADHGATGRRELARMVGARYWGPGVFGAALRQAMTEGTVRRLSRGTYGPVEDDR